MCDDLAEECTAGREVSKGHPVLHSHRVKVCYMTLRQTVTSTDRTLWTKIKCPTFGFSSSF